MSRRQSLSYLGALRYKTGEPFSLRALARLWLRPLPDADVVSRIRAKNYELVFFRNAVQTPILQLRNWFYPGGAWVGNTGFNEPMVADLLTEAGSSSDPAKIKELLRKVELFGVEDSTYIPLTSQFSLSGIRHARGVLEAVNPGEYLFVKTTPALPVR